MLGVIIILLLINKIPITITMIEKEQVWEANCNCIYKPCEIKCEPCYNFTLYDAWGTVWVNDTFNWKGSWENVTQEDCKTFYSSKPIIS